MKTVVALRLARHHNTRNSPVFDLVAIPSSRRTTARPLEVLGTYNPRPVLPPSPSISPNGARRGKEWGPPQASKLDGTVGQKTVVWNQERVQWWLSKGAQPSDRVRKLLQSAGVVPTPSPRIPRRETPEPNR